MIKPLTRLIYAAGTLLVLTLTKILRKILGLANVQKKVRKINFKLLTDIKLKIF